MKYLQFVCEIIVLNTYFLYLIRIVAPLSFTSAKTKIYDNKIVERFDLILVNQPNNGSKKLFNGTCQYNVEVKSLEVEATLDFERQTNKWIRFSQLKCNVCEMFKLGQKYKNNRFLRGLIRKLKQNKAFTQPCPAPAHMIYEFSQFDVDFQLPQQLPNVSFKSHVKGYTEGHLIWTIDVAGFTKDYFAEK